MDGNETNTLTADIIRLWDIQRQRPSVDSSGSQKQRLTHGSKLTTLMQYKREQRRTIRQDGEGLEHLVDCCTNRVGSTRPLRNRVYAAAVDANNIYVEMKFRVIFII